VFEVIYAVDHLACFTGDVALGLGFGVGGNLIHILLVVALVVLIVNLIQGRRVV
jgi:hypothetical protein